MILSLGAWWPEGRSSSSISQFLPSCSWSACQMAAEWKNGHRGDLSPWLFLQLCFCSVWGRCPAERGGQTQRCAQLSARLSAELCSPDLWRYYTTLRCTESIHFLWPLNRKFSGLLVRPWISSAVADGTVFAWLSWPVFDSEHCQEIYFLAYKRTMVQEDRGDSRIFLMGWHRGAKIQSNLVSQNSV